MRETPKAMTDYQSKTGQDVTMDNPQVTERDLIWLACFIDCEGSIQLVLTKGSKSNTAIHARVQLPSTDAVLICELQRILRSFGVNPHLYQHIPNSKNGRAKESYTLSFQKFSHIKRVLEAILPHLIAKAAQAQLLLDYIKHRTDDGSFSGKRKPIADTDYGYWAGMKKLNARGTSETTRVASV